VQSACPTRISNDEHGRLAPEDRDYGVPVEGIGTAVVGFTEGKGNPRQDRFLFLGVRNLVTQERLRVAPAKHSGESSPDESGIRGYYINVPEA
jgi:hypothetical protein